MRTLKRALMVLETFSLEHPHLSLSEITRAIDLPKSTTFRIVRMFEELGYLERREDGRFSLTHKVVRLADIAFGSFDVRDVAQPIMEDLARTCGESVTLNAIVHGERVCLHVVTMPSDAKSVNVPGEHVPLGLGGAAMVLMAFQNKIDLKGVLAAAARRAGCTQKELSSILDNVRKQGYAVSHGGGVPGYSGISAPIFDRDGAARYCISILLPTSRVRGRVSALVLLVRRAGAGISISLGTPRSGVDGRGDSTRTPGSTKVKLPIHSREP